ncbi:dentin sialophosphoprotein isoform X1 [Rosa chinensis]|uniref:dentin sialophosphoprotein isoform X1 n=1 Tax=Rosa chinensis TaxID=74649 RepID=UPI000D095561|nr:dentin sialophosphoprotein isoform X1 [Rosa chinensis]
MYGGSSKHGHGRLGGGAGRGAGAAKLGRASFPPPHRNSAGPAAANRLSLGGSNHRGGRNPPAPATSAAAPAVEEKFSLVAGNNPVAFSMIIRLVPDLVDEIRRVEAQGGTPRIKFDSMTNNPNGNVIDVGGKEFRFTWSRDGDLCDIYEERETGEDGNGLLVESGCAWRKVNVQRILDESTKNHVKRRSEEAERLHKSRKAIVLEQNPAMKNQLKQFTAATANSSWRNFKQKKEPPFKKQKVEPPQVSAPPKSAYKSGVSSATTGKGRQSSSPLPSTPEKSASPFGMLNISKTHTSADETIPSQVIIKDKPAPSLDKETSIRTSAALETGKGNGRAKPTDLQSLLITLLMENPKGMSLKALEKAIGDSFPNSLKKIEPILKKIANSQAPGKYLLKPGVELESFKKPLFESGSSPEENLRQTPAKDNVCDQRPAQIPEFKEKVSSSEMEEQGQGQLNATVGEEPQVFQKIDNQQQSPDLFGEKRASDNSEAQIGSSSSSESGSDSDSESDSSDSGSDSGSPSRSKSPKGSGSGSSSDSESDVSSNSKEVSDEDVNIMSDDDKEPKHQTQASEAALPIPWETPDGRLVQSGNDDKQDDLESDAIDIETVEQDAELAVVSSSTPNKCDQPVDEKKPSSPEHVEHHDRQILVDSLFGKTADKDDFRYEQSDSSERMTKGKSKRGLEVKHSDEKSERRKRSKTENSPQPPASVGKGVQFSEDYHNLSPDRLIEGSYKGPVSQTLNKADRDGNTEFGSQKGYNQAVSGRYSSESKQLSRKSYDHSAQAKAPDQGERPDRYSESLGHGLQYSEKSSHVHEGLPLRKDNVHSSSQKDGYANEKKVSRNSKEGGGRGKQSVPLDSHYQKHGDVAGKIKEDRQVSSMFVSSSPKENRNGADRSPVVNGRGSKLQREVSELELGELREAVPEETTVKKQFERKSSFKQSENKLGTRDTWASDFSKSKPAGKPSSPDLNLKFPSNAEGLVKKRNYEDRIEDLTGSQQRALQSQSLHLSRVDNSDVGRPFSRSADNSSKSTQNEVGGRQGISLDGYGESNKKAPPRASQHHDSKRGPLSHTNKESKRLASSTMMEQTDVRKDSMLAEGTDSDRKRRDSSSDENSCSYTKYEKDEPELKGPIKDFSQYKEYVQEYHDKYDSYCSLNKILESYRNEFLKLGKDLEFASGTERYYNVLDQLKESYRQCGSRHKRLKKIFVVLHEELKHLKQRIKEFALPYTKD